MSLRKIAVLLAAGGLAVGLIGGGVGAQFTDSVQAIQHISVGTFSCVISDGGGGVLSNNNKTVTFSAFNITSSAAGTDPIHFTVQNTGSIGDVLTVSTTPVQNPPFSIIGMPFAPVPLAPGATHLYNTGIQWTTLDNSNLGQQGDVTWTVNCGEAAAGVGFPAGSYYAVNNGGTQFAAGTWVRSTSPIASTAVVGGGTATQSLSGGNVSLAITGGGSYADNGFYVPLGTLSSLAASGFTATGIGSQFGTNVYFDTNADGFFGWTGNYLTSIAPDTYGLGPTSAAGTLTVTGASTYDMTCNGVYGSYSLTPLASSGCSEGVSGSTPVAVWIGITSGGAALSTTITSAP